MNETELSALKTYGNNELWCSNTLISGKKYNQIFLSIFLFSIPYIIMLSILIKFYDKYSYSSLIPIIIISLFYIISIFSALRGGFTDPGILTRQTKDFYFNSYRNTIRCNINGHILNLNYCYTCSIYRPPRTSHCAVCDNCVERFDHHCIWLGTCVGKRNYKFFYLLIASLNLTAYFEIGYCIFLIVFHAKKNKKDKYNIIVIVFISFVLVFDVCFVVFFIGKLFFLHSYLVFKNLTFYEHIKEKWKKPPGINLLYKGICYTWYRLICLFTPKSSLDVFYDNNNNNVKSENSDNDFYRIPGSVNSRNIEKDNASRNHLRDVEDSIIKNSKLKKNKKNRNLTLGDRDNNMFMGTQEDYKNTDGLV